MHAKNITARKNCDDVRHGAHENAGNKKYEAGCAEPVHEAGTGIDSHDCQERGEP